MMTNSRATKKEERFPDIVSFIHVILAFTHAIRIIEEKSTTIISNLTGFDPLGLDFFF